MVKINENIFKKATGEANLKTREINANEKTQRVTVYEIPVELVKIIKDNKKKLFPLNNISAYIKQAFIEKMKKDKLI